MTKRTGRFFSIPRTAETGDYRARGLLAHAVFGRDGLRCVYCGARATEGAEIEIDHVRPASHFSAGTERDVVNATSNLVTACESCNNVKGGCGLEGFIEKLLALGVSLRSVDALRLRVEAATSTIIE